MMDARVACETLPYSEFALERALEGIAGAGYEYVALGRTHQKVDVLPTDASDGDAEAVARKVADAGLKTCVIFAATGDFSRPDAVATYRRGLEFAGIMGVPQMLSWGPWEYKEWPGEKWADDEWHKISESWFDGMMQVVPYAEQLGIEIVLKPHTGVTAYGERLRYAVERIGSETVRVCYDGGNVHFYEGYDPAEDIKDCAEYVTAFCIKDHSGPRANPLFPPPGEGDVDDAAMLRVVNEYGFDGPLMVERFEGNWAKADMPIELIDERARVARLYLERTLAGI
jgi:sugar phosphate isomerase/epimerase